MSRPRIMDRRAVFSTAAAATLLAATGVSASAPKPGGRLRIALSGAARTDDWLQGDGLFMQVARQGLVFDTLTEVAADGTLRPELSLSWTSTGDGRIWNFELRPNVTFHDQTPLTAADVVASLEPLLAAKIAPEGRHRVKIALAQPDHALPLRLSGPEYVIRPAHALSEGIGTGLYQVKSFAPGQRLVSERVQNHYKDDLAGWFHEVELTSIPSEGVRAQALAEFLVDAVDVTAANALKDLPDLALQPDRRDPVQAISSDVMQPLRLGYQRPLDNLRAPERWWFR